ncbi:MAG: hypothetical protein A3I32_00675 [Candidatus Yanofskybacteria bacterium RIFCSPLOWO2_02_FULL_45_10]|uniref:Uncharacterized protein n=3 Tax=Patescibacteria group TaxID=1783273 RepID=A0A1F8G497_9BACT|nr:MAG: hypothetical protein A3F25_00490 [Candidatus Yanofskybacteria bacterium RIFCSPHIGHO2_12_FULL_45_19b]OGN32489.1 MAG: hypothetical protein A3I32_00675 [Candidatus Yanofskybacteria bacterium RIFCSPLOWO2_02_FULL_45_10]
MKKILLSTTVCLSLILLSAGVPDALAVGNAYFPQNTTLTLDGSNYTIVQSSNADQISTSGDTLTLLMSAGQEFVLTSADRRVMTNSGNYSYSCSSSQSSLTVNIPVGSSQTTVTVTPKGDCTTSNVSGGGGGTSGGGGGGGSASATPTTTPSVTPSASPVGSTRATPKAHGLKEGDTVSAQGSNDPDIYIVNEHGFKRLFLNPIIFNFYGHLGGFSKVNKITATTRDVFEVSGLFRNCESNDKKVYGVEVTGEDVGMLHHVNLTGDQAVAQDAEFFKKVFCINNNEFNWYTAKGTNFGSVYSALSQLPIYKRK